MNRQNGSRVSSIIAGVVGFVVIFMVLAVLFPLFVPHGNGSKSSTCYANLKQIGNSIKMYLADWNETYPTNRAFTSEGKLGRITSKVQLSDIRENQDGKPYRFQHGVNWVEALYTYMEPIAERNDTTSVWKCPASSLSAATDSAQVSYAFNRNLIEQPEKVVKSGNTLLLVSEVEGLLDAELRPVNKSNKNPKEPPKRAYTSAKLHHNGSHILFADGHVKLYSAEHYLTTGFMWDPQTKAWFSRAAAEITELNGNVWNGKAQKWDEKTKTWVDYEPEPVSNPKPKYRPVIQITP